MDADKVNSTLAVSLSDAKRKLFEMLQHGEMCQQKAGFCLHRRATREPSPLSLMQEQLWKLETQTPGIPPIYNESVTLRRFGALNPEILERSFAEVIRRHEIWRTSYDTVKGQAVQVLHPPYERFSLPRIDLRDLPAPEREGHVLRLAQDQGCRAFDLRNGPLLRATLVQLSDAEHRVVMTVHQSIIDGVSVYQILPLELAKIYQAFSTGRGSPLADLPVQFTDFARWQRDWLQGEARERQIGFWRRRLFGDVPILRWPSGRPRPAGQTYRGKIRSFTLPAILSRTGRILGQAEGTTQFIVLLAAFYVLLHQYTGQTDLVVGTFSPAGRKRSEVQSLLGYFLNPVSLRIDISDHPSFVQLLRRTQRITSEALSNDDVPFEHVVEELQPRSDPSRNPYFTVGISLQPPSLCLEGAWSATSMDAESGGAKLDLYVAFIDRPEGLHARVQYNPDLFEYSAVKQLIGDFQALLEIAITYPETRITHLQPASSPIGCNDGSDPTF